MQNSLTKESTKIGSSANINKHLLTDGTMKVKYRWERVDRNLKEFDGLHLTAN